MFFLFEIIAFEPVGRISLIYDENTCDRQSTVLQFLIYLREMFSTCICPRLIGKYDKSAAVLVSAVFGTREHFGSRMVF